jgi:hypothetical protein
MECAVLDDTLPSGSRKNSAKSLTATKASGVGAFALTVKFRTYGPAPARLQQTGQRTTQFMMIELARAAAQLDAGAGRGCESRVGPETTGLESVQHSYFIAPVR